MNGRSEQITRGKNVMEGEEQTEGQEGAGVWMGCDRRAGGWVGGRAGGHRGYIIGKISPTHKEK